MSRVKWKALIFYKNLIVKNKNFILSKNKIKIIPRFLIVNPYFVGKNYLVHNGKNLIKLKIYFNMIGYKFGSFVFTKFFITKN